MHILSDLLPLQVEPTRNRGIGHYTRCALAAAIRQAPDGQTHMLATHRSLPPAAWCAAGNAAEATIEVDYPFNGYRPDTWREHESAWGSVWQALVDRHACDVLYVHSPFEVAAPPHRRPARARLVVTVYDLIPLIYPDQYLAKAPPWYAAHYRRACELVRQADQIVTISECSRQDLVERLSIEPARIQVAPPGPSPNIVREPRPEVALALRCRYGLRGGYVLCTSGYDYRKNLPRTLEAYAALPEELRHDFPLVIVCRLNAAEERSLRTDVKRRRLEQQVVLTNFVADEELAALYRMATVQFFPSLYEGFGLPALDAMACGLPVVTSNTSSLPEVVGDAAVIADPTDAPALSAALARVLASESLRTEMRARGLKQAAQFSWERAGQVIVNVYQALNVFCGTRGQLL